MNSARLCVTLPLFCALVLIHVLIGGTRLLYAIPAYALLAVPALLATWKRSHWSPASKNCIASTAVFCAYIALRSYFSPVEYLARTDLYLIAAAAVVYLLSACFMNTQKERLLLLIGLILLSLADVCIGVIQFKNNNNYLPFGFLRPDYGARASGFYVCPNHLAGYLETIMLAGLSAVFWMRRRIPLKILITYTVAFALFGLTLTGSRGGYLSTLVGLFVFLGITIPILRQFYPERSKFLTLTIIFAACAILAISVAFMTRSTLLRSRLDRIVEKNMRLELWKAAWSTFKLQPVLGTGSSTYLIYGRQFRSPTVQYDPVYVHNDYLHLLTEFGIAGSAAFLWFLVAHLYHGCAGLKQIVRKLLESGPPPRSDSLALTVGALCAVAACIAHSIVDFNMHIPSNALLFAFLFGILANPRYHPPHHNEHAVNFTARMILALLGLLIVCIELPKLPGEYFTEQSRVALRDKHFDEAIAFSLKGTIYEKRNPDLYFYLGEASRLRGNSGKDSEKRANDNLEAVKAFQAGLELFPQDERAALKLGLAMDMLGRYAEAEAIFQHAIKIDPNLGEIYAHYGLHLQFQGKMDEARKQFERANQLTNSAMARQAIEELNGR